MINAMKLHNIEVLGQDRALAETHWYFSFLVIGTIFKLNCLDRILISLFLQDIHAAQNTSCFPLVLFHSTLFWKYTMWDSYHLHTDAIGCWEEYVVLWGKRIL